MVGNGVGFGNSVHHPSTRTHTGLRGCLWKHHGFLPHLLEEKKLCRFSKFICWLNKFHDLVRIKYKLSPHVLPGFTCRCEQSSQDVCPQLRVVSGRNWGWWECQVKWERLDPHSLAQTMTAAGQLSPGRGIELYGGVNRVVDNKVVREKQTFILKSQDMI